MTILSTGSPVFLPMEIIWDMLSYLPVKSLLRFKCVCKHWNVITQDFPFICLHIIRTPLSIGKKPPETTTDEDEFKLVDLSSSNLLLEYSCNRLGDFPFSINLRYRIRNPAIQHQILEIPDSERNIVTMSLVFDPYYQVLKLLSYVYGVFGDQLMLGYEVLDLRNEENSYSWRPIVRNLPQQRGGETGMFSPIIKHSDKMKVEFALGTGYIIWNIALGNSPIGIDIVDMVNDSYIGHIAFPRSNFYTRDDCILWNGKLSLAKVVKDEVHVLLLDDDYKQQIKWADVSLIIKLPFITREVSAVQEQITFIRVVEFNKLWFWWKKDKDKEPLCIYDITTGKLETSRLNLTEISSYVFRRPCLVTFRGINTVVV